MSTMTMNAPTDVPTELETDEIFQNEIESNVTCFHGPNSRRCSGAQTVVTAPSPIPASPVNPTDGDHDEPIDPRVQIELETLNTLTDLINKLELELDDARADFRLTLSSSSTKLKQLAGKLGACIEKARPYYEARIKSKELQNETQKAAIRYERAMSAAAAAKEMVKLAEEGLNEEGKIFDPAWQEMLNHATCRVNSAEEERCASQAEHARTSTAFIQAEQFVSNLQSQLKRPIVKARTYYEMKAAFNQKMDEKIRGIKELECKVSKAKTDYSNALGRLEGISCEIHERRKCSVVSKSTHSSSGLDSSGQENDLREKFRGLSVSQVTVGVQNRPSAIVNPWLSSTTSNSSSSCHPSSDDGNDCFSDSVSVDTVDTLDDAAINNLMLDSEINNHVNKCVQLENHGSDSRQQWQQTEEPYQKY